MKTFSTLLLEYKTDLMAKCVIIIGGPGAGKTYWMTEHDGEDSGYKQLFKQPSVAKRLDMDHNLEQVQKENAKEVASILFGGLQNGADKKWFDSYIKQKQSVMDTACERGESPKVDLSIISFDFIKEWTDKINDEKNKFKFKQEFIRAFVKEYWKPIFASDFSRRNASKAEYKKTFWQKLSGLEKNEDGEIIGDIFSDSDVCIAITGDKLSKIEEVINASKGHHAIYIVYLDIPVEMSIAADKKRDRHVGEDMVREKIAGVHKTWATLKEKYEDLGIWKMYHMETPLGKYPKWQITDSYINKKLIKASHQR